MIKQKKDYGVYHWDTFDNETFLICEADSEEQAEELIYERYAGRICNDGADKVDIVNRSGTIVKQFSVR